MSTQAAATYSEEKVFVNCLICAEKFKRGTMSLVPNIIGNVCAWCYSRKLLYARFTKLIQALEDMSEVHGDRQDCTCDGHGVLYNIRKAMHAT